MGPKIIAVRNTNAKQLQDRLKLIGKRYALLGIPASSSRDRKEQLLAMAGDIKSLKSKRKEKLVKAASQDINNAELLWIFSKGSPIRNQPARPVLEPAVMADGNRNIIAREIAGQVKATLEGDETKASEQMKRAGIAGQNAARGWFTDSRNGWKQNSRYTIREKLEPLTGKRRKEALDILDSHVGEIPLVGVSAKLDSINTPGIDTGAMRAAITYVLKDEQ